MYDEEQQEQNTTEPTEEDIQWAEENAELIEDNS